MSRRFLPARRRRTERGRSVPALVLGVLVLLAATVTWTLTDANLIEPGRVGDQQQAVAPQDLLPDACRTGGASVTHVVSGGTSIDVSSSSDGNLLLADTSTTTITGGSGDDCLVGTSATTTLDGGSGTHDVCIGVAGTVFVGCETQVTT